MGVRASIYLISQEAYECALRGDNDGLEAGCEGPVADLDKAWHAIHYLLTGDRELRFLTTGTQIQDVSESCEVHSPQAIAQLGERLAHTSHEDLLAAYSADEFNANKIYPDGWSDSDRGYVGINLGKCLGVLRSAHEGKKGIFVVLA